MTYQPATSLEGMYEYVKREMPSHASWKFIVGPVVEDRSMTFVRLEYGINFGSQMIICEGKGYGLLEACKQFQSAFDAIKPSKTR